MVFVNEIAEIVHGVADSFHGAANKNIGDAFLMVWKIPEDLMYVNNENQLIVIDQPEVVNQIADMSLLAFIKLSLRLRSPQRLKNITNTKAFNSVCPTTA